MNPSHHRPGGGFRIPWPMEPGDVRRAGDFLRWQLQRWRNGRTPSPGPDAFPIVEPKLELPRLTGPELRTTWIGQATFLLQLPGANLLTDPVWSLRASPFRRIGPRRLAPPPIPLDRLPPIDGVLLSHDHYDHLDADTIRLLARDHPRAVWFAPLGYRELITGMGVQEVRELDWWQEAQLAGGITITAAPTQHWTRRIGSPVNARLWCSFAVRASCGSIYFGGDTGHCAIFEGIGARLGPFDHVLLPIGAYEPRWFMKAAHMNPEEAVAVYEALGGTGEFVAMHWGTFRLTDEPPLEPPERVRAAWLARQLPIERLHVLAHGQTLISPCSGDGRQRLKPRST